ncbi:MAG: L,D-transpeptidase family protein [Sphingobacteriales bacterium]
MTIPFSFIKSHIRPLFLLSLCTLFISIQGCKKKRSELASLLYKKTPNKVFKKLDPDQFATIFEGVLDSEKTKLKYPQAIKDFYDTHNYEPVFLLANLKNDELKTLVDYYDKANDQGLDSNMFQAQQVRTLLAKFYDKKAIKTVDEAYHDMAELELMTANSLIKYSNAIQYGVVNPKNIYKRYFIATKEADSTSINQALNETDLKTYLDSIQSKDPQYIALQKAYTSNTIIPGTSPEESKRIFMVNLERLRWKNKPTESKYVIVNIPDFHLDVMDGGKSVLGMEVCVGKGRNLNYAKNLMNYQDTDQVDRPVHETPLLNSLIYEAEVNPVWNIPESIVNKEIMVQAAKDPYYLSNKNINVYKNGAKVENVDSIDWANIDKSEYSFQQQPGEDNSLGKVKFLFKNKSSVYLHDTPAKLPFAQSMRAVSHGCVRLQKPQDFAHALFGDGPKYDLIAKDMAADKPDPTEIALPKKMPVYITYTTCWADSTGTLQYRKDVYGQDIILYANLIKAK